VASTGADLNDAVAAGILAISRLHGGAIEEAQRLFLEIAKRADAQGWDEAVAARLVLDEMKAKGRRASGFGHRLHTKDPRTGRLFDLAEKEGLSGRYACLARTTEKALAAQSGKPLPINVDGAIAALLCDLGIPPEIGNAFFFISRVPGLVAHVHEEKTRMKPMRRIDPEGYVYDGPPERKLP
jgi:citrate synthase